MVADRLILRSLALAASELTELQEFQTSPIGDYYNYTGGTAFSQGVPSPDGTDLWFREGSVVPEPSTLPLAVIGAGALFWRLKQGT